MLAPLRTSWLLVAAAQLAVTTSAAAGTSDLWGADGADWDPRGRLADYSWAGYKAGAASLPNVPQVTTVTAHGAVADDNGDDTAAFQAAIDATDSGAIFIPAGRYRISAPLRISKSDIVLRGASQWSDGSVLDIDVSLSDVNGPSPTYGWGNGGFIHVDSPTGPATMSGGAITEPARRGDTTLTVTNGAQFQPGMMVELLLTNPADDSLWRHLHNEQLSSWSGCGDVNDPHIEWPVEVARVEGNMVTLVQPLRTDVALAWNPRFKRWRGLRNVGIERLRFEFPDIAAPPHHDEVGYNGVYMVEVANSWVDRVAIVHADVGVSIGARSKWVDVRDVRLYGRRGHHGLMTTRGHDILFTDFYFGNDWIHALTVTKPSSGNVFSNGTTHATSPRTIHLDHHRTAPFENLFSNIAAPTSWSSGGNYCDGPHGAARNTYWNLKGAVGPPSWGPYQNNVIGDLSVAQQLTANGPWYEEVASLTPADLHASQRARRLALNPPTVFGVGALNDRDAWRERDPARWRVTDFNGQGAWRYHLYFGDHPNLSGGRLGEYAVLPGQPFANVRLRARAKTGESLTGNPYADVALIAGYQDDENYYYGMVNATAGETRLFRVVNGQRTAIGTGSSVAITDLGLRWVELRRQGDQLELRYAGEVAATATDTTFGPGLVGLGSYNDSVWFDDVSATCLADCAGKACGDDGCGGSCGGCDDGNPCTDDGCTAAGACTATNHTRPCDDADACTVDDACGGGTCAGDVPDETCDGQDNDCDGDTDEAWPLLGAACDSHSGGPCASGVLVCDAGGASLRCDAVAGVAAEDERCDGVDNDCDGDTDEGFAIGGPCGEGSGTCRGSGVQVCGDDQVSTVCSASAFPAGTPCYDANPCTADDRCTGGSQSTCVGTAICGPADPGPEPGPEPTPEAAPEPAADGATAVDAANTGDALDVEDVDDSDGGPASLDGVGADGGHQPLAGGDSGCAATGGDRGGALLALAVALAALAARRRRLRAR